METLPHFWKEDYMKYKCDKCGLSFSDKIYPIHVGICKGKETEQVKEGFEGMKFNELRSLAKTRGLDVGKNPTTEILLTALRGD